MPPQFRQANPRYKDLTDEEIRWLRDYNRRENPGANASRYHAGGADVPRGEIDVKRISGKRASVGEEGKNGRAARKGPDAFGNVEEVDDAELRKYRREHNIHGESKPTPMYERAYTGFLKMFGVM